MKKPSRQFRGMNGRQNLMDRSEYRSNLMSSRVAGSIAAGLLHAFLLISITNGQGLVNEAEALADLPGLYVLGGDVDESLKEYKISKDDLLVGITTVLLDEGVPVLDEMDWLTVESAPVVHLDLHSEKGVYRVLLEVLYLVHPVSSPDVTAYAVIWSRERLGPLSDQSSSAIETASRELAEELANDFRSNM